MRVPLRRIRLRVSHGAEQTSWAQFGVGSDPNRTECDEVTGFGMKPRRV